MTALGVWATATRWATSARPRWSGARVRGQARGLREADGPVAQASPQRLIGSMFREYGQAVALGAKAKTSAGEHGAARRPRRVPRARCSPRRSPRWPSAAARSTRCSRSRLACALPAPHADREHVRRHDLIPPGGEVVCLVSGGADSTCLWHALGVLGYRVSALHVNHGCAGRSPRRTPASARERLGAEVVEAPRRRARPRPSFATCATRSPPPAPGDRAHRLRPGRDDPLPPRRERDDRRASASAATTASSVRF